MRKTFLSLSIITLALISFLFNTPTASASGIGYASGNAVASDSVIVGFRYATNYYQPRGNDFYEICWRKTSNGGLACNHNSVRTENEPFLLQGLDANTEYKIKVKCYCRKIAGWVGFNPTQWRTIDSFKITTGDPSNDGTTTSTLTGRQMTSLDVSWTHTQNDQFSLWRVCYKQTNTAFLLNDACAIHHFNNNNEPTWASNKSHGWQNHNNHIASSYDATLNGLTPCTQYTIVIYGFYTSDINGIKLGELSARTKGFCGIIVDSMFRAVLADHEEIQAHYAAVINNHYGDTTLYGHLIQTYPELADEQAILLEDNVDIQNNIYDLFTHLDSNHYDILQAWQQELAAQETGLDMDTFSQAYYPEQYEAWFAENNGGADSLLIMPTDEWLYTETEHPAIGCALLDTNPDCVTISLLTDEPVELSESDLCLMLAVEGSTCPVGDGNAIVIWPQDEWIEADDVMHIGYVKGTTTLIGVGITDIADIS